MEENAEKQYTKLHGIQLQSVNIAELSIRLNKAPEDCEIVGDDIVTLSHGHSKYNEEDKSIQVGLILEVGMKNPEDAPFTMRIEIFGSFTVDEEKFPKKYVTDWAQKGAHYILMPYLREQLYSLSLRTGLSPLILPMAELPPYTIKDTSQNT